MDFIYHHTDLDGRAAAAILTRKFPEAGVYPYNYWYEFDKSFNRVHPDAHIIFADITPTIDNLIALLTITENITIIDHHSSSLKDLREANLEFQGIQTEDGLGACALTWEWACKDNPKPIPFGIQCIAEYDAWQRNADNKRFNFGIQTFNTFPTNSVWDRILRDDTPALNKILDTGAKVMSYLVPYYKRLVRSYSISGYINYRETDGSVRPYSAIFLNAPAADSSVFDDAEGSFDVYIRGVFGKNQKWLISITTNRDDIDVSSFAQEFGGGGHAKSSGCSVEDLFDLFSPNKMIDCIELPTSDQVHS